LEKGGSQKSSSRDEKKKEWEDKLIAKPSSPVNLMGLQAVQKVLSSFLKQKVTRFKCDTMISMLPLITKSYSPYPNNTNEKKLNGKEKNQ